jgi:hypothetical protein
MALVVQHPTIAKLFKPAKLQELPIADSKFLQNVSYDPDNSQMTVTMKNGAQYVYFNIPPGTMEDFAESKSKGKFYADNIRGQASSQRTIDKTVGKKVPKVS